MSTNLKLSRRRFIYWIHKITLNLWLYQVAFSITKRDVFGNVNYWKTWRRRFLFYLVKINQAIIIYLNIILFISIKRNIKSNLYTVNSLLHLSLLWRYFWLVFNPFLVSSANRDIYQSYHCNSIHLQQITLTLSNWWVEYYPRISRQKRSILWPLRSCTVAPCSSGITSIRETVFFFMGNY